MGSPGCDWANLAANRSRDAAPPKTKMIFFWVAWFDDFTEALPDFAFFVAPDGLADWGILLSGALVESVGCSIRSLLHPPVRRIVANDKLAAIECNCFMCVKLSYLLGNRGFILEKFLLVQAEKYSHSQRLKSQDSE